jgi:pyrimidine-nucleoside phosphorylase
MNILEVIAQKQGGNELDTATIEQVIERYTHGQIPDYQMAALLMAIFFQGMSRRETVDLAKAMVQSGETARHNGIPSRKVDKHSTGGVGDKTSLLIAPIVASLGVPVPMISGRGLGHTGGTLDKLESIPGFTTRLTLREFENQVEKVGCALIGQTDEIVPADQKMYALRDVTSTVRSVPLICGSILSKKVAEGIDALLLDVKFGRGAVYNNLGEARNLAQHLVTIGTALGLEIQALLTDMDQPLGLAVGNWLEVKECVQILIGEGGGEDLADLALTESALMLMLGEHAVDYERGRVKAEEALRSGKAYQKFIEIVRSQKADVSVIEDHSNYPAAAHQHVFSSSESGFIQDINALAIGVAAVALGAGRQRKEDKIDYTAGFEFHAKRGDFVEEGDPVVTIHAGSADRINRILPDVEGAILIGTDEPPERPLIVSLLTEECETSWTY